MTEKTALRENQPLIFKFGRPKTDWQTAGNHGNSMNENECMILNNLNKY